MNVFTPFGYLFAETIVKEDCSELKQCEYYLRGSGQDNFKGKDYSNFHVLDDYPHTKKIMEQYSKKFIRENFCSTNKFEITTSWLVNLAHNDRIHLHHHKNCVFSAVFYYGEYTQKTCGLQFKNPVKEQIPLYVKDYEMNPMTCSLEIKPEHNQLIIFPSWMYHFSNLNKEEDRRSLAFNLAPIGEIGDGDSTIFI